MNNESTENKKPDKNVLLTYEEISNHNLKIMERNTSLINLNTYPKTITKNQLINMITDYNINQKYYNNGKLIEKNTIENIIQNTNINNISDNINVTKGIVINRSNLRIIPTDLGFFDNENDTHFDRMQETALHIGMPILILHESLDKKWCFVQNYFSKGWILKDDIAIANNEQFDYFLNPEKFVIITEPLLKINNRFLDMSVKLPCIKTINNQYEVVIPSKKNNDLIYEKIYIGEKYANIGYLDYNYDTLFEQLYKYNGTNYGWGDLDNGVDCTSLVANVYRTFGFMFPRNSSEQYNTVGTQIFNLEGLTNDEKKNLLINSPPGILYMKGHALVYLKHENNFEYVIHAYGNAMKVVITTIENTYGKNLYDKLISFNLLK